MEIKITPILLGIDRCYLLQERGTILIDGGMPFQSRKFRKALKKVSVKPREIGLILLTHGHIDHAGSAKSIKEITGAPVAVHYRESDWLEKSLKPIPPGITVWGKIFERLIKMCLPFIRLPATSVDILLDDSERSLNGYGISGKIIYTPGHTMGSVSVLLENGDAFVGDLAMSGFPVRFSPGLPILADDLEMVKESLRQLLARGARMIYPAHGKPFSADIIRRMLSA